MDAGMIALLPEDPGALVVDSKSALPAPEIHLTLVYLGDDVTGWQEDRCELLIRDVAMAVQGLGGAIDARVMGHATFNPDGGPDGTFESCAVHLIGHSGVLTPLRDLISEVCEARLGVDYPTQHQPFLPHVTAGYGLTAADLTYTGPVVFNRIVVAIAGRWAEISLRPPPEAEAIAPYARTAYAQGWAQSRGPMTERVRAGCTAAVQLAVTNADRPGILEATMRLGSLEGTWAAVYARREALVAKHLAVVLAAWRRAAHMLNLKAAIDRFRQSLGVGEAVDVDNTDHRRLVANSIAGSVASAIAGPDAIPADREAIVLAVADAVRDAQAEGTAGAIAAGADQLGVAGVSFDIAFTDAHQALGDLGNYWGQAGGWVDRMVSGTATDLGGRLSALAADGASYQEMLDAAQDVIGGEDIRSVEAILDLAMGQSFSRGALALYGREGVTQVDYVTAGGSRVCALCLDAENNNPWSLSAVPQPPLHPFCVIGSTRVAVPGSARAATVRDYVGDVCTVRTAAGYELTGTPNHPVATRCGWVALSELGVGDHVLSSSGSEGKVFPVNPDVDDVPPTIEQVAKSFPVGLGPMPVAAEDFHGDGAGSDVHVVWTDRLLVDDGQPLCPEHGAEVDLGCGDVPVCSSLVGSRAGVERFGVVGGSTPGSMGGGGEPGAFLRGRPSHASAHAFAAVAWLDASSEQEFVDGGAADREGFCQRLDALSSVIAADQVIHVERWHFAGHVYNLDTSAGWYISNGIVSHNCRCNVQPTDPMQGLMGLLTQYIAS